MTSPKSETHKEEEKKPAPTPKAEKPVEDKKPEPKTHSPYRSSDRSDYGDV